MSNQDVKGISRRDFMKIAGLAGVALQAGGMVAGGVAAGKDPESYTGWESFNPGTQFFNRKPFEFEGPAHTPVGEVRRPSHLTDYVFGRVAMFQKALETHPNWAISDPLEDLEFPPPLLAFYKEFPERLEWDYKTFTETIPTNKEDAKIYGNNYLLANVYASGFSAVSAFLPAITDPPEVSDFNVKNAKGELKPIRPDPLPFKSPDLAAEFIKQIAHLYGATLVRITTANIDWHYGDGWRGTPEGYDHSKLPAHWKYAIMIGVPMEWDVVLSNPQFGTSDDAYNRVSIAALRLEGALKSMGYAARTNSPVTGYDLVEPPYAIQAGMGEVGRTGFCITPELGGNCRMAAVLTNLELAIDKPIKYGVEEFCKKCKICAEQCPSGAISMADSPDGLVIRGFEHWYINNGACYNFWRESMGPMGCRMCVANCPYSRKDNWMHNIARELDPRDPTGVFSSGLLWMQKNFFEHPTAEEYRRPPIGEFASYRPEPFYLHSETYLDVKVEYPTH